MTDQGKSMTSTEILSHLQGLIGSKLNIQGLKQAGHWLAAKANELLPGEDGATKKQWAKGHLLAVVESYDNLVPVVGQYLDLPFVDGLEKSAVDVAVEKGYAWLITSAPKPVTNDPDLKPGGVEQ